LIRGQSEGGRWVGGSEGSNRSGTEREESGAGELLRAGEVFVRVAGERGRGKGGGGGEGGRGSPSEDVLSAASNIVGDDRI
jgi:hypothetical protein